MPFLNDLPEWNSVGTEPTQTKKDEGWKIQEKPPAPYFNWFFNRTFQSLQDIINNAIHKEQKGVANGVAQLNAEGKVINADGTTAGEVTQEEFSAHLAERGSKTAYGHVKVGSGINVIDGVISVEEMTASNVSIDDAGGYFNATDTEGALQEMGQTLNAMRGSLIESVNNILNM
jgi:predicted DNA repair protein MutK